MTTLIRHKIGQKLFTLFTISFLSLSFCAVNIAYADVNYPAAKILDVPFSTQAPLGEWNDPRQADGCEETSIIMAWQWATGISLSPEQVRMYITGMSDYEMYFHGYFRDSSAQDTANLMTKYFGYPNVSVSQNITLTDIKAALDNNKLVITPINPRIISTKYFNRYTINHTVVVVGYDDARGTVIIHNPLHSWGGNVHIAQDIFENSLADYRSGQIHRPDNQRAKVMIVISKVE